MIVLIALFVIGLHGVFEEYYICAKCEIDISIYRNIMTKITLTQTEQDQTLHEMVFLSSKSELCNILGLNIILQSQLFHQYRLYM